VVTPEATAAFWSDGVVVVRHARPLDLEAYVHAMFVWFAL
jgi:hypothetical protein